MGFESSRIVISSNNSESSSSSSLVDVSLKSKPCKLWYVLCVFFFVLLFFSPYYYFLTCFFTKKKKKKNWYQNFELKIFERANKNRAHKMMINEILVEHEVDCSIVRIWYKKLVLWRNERLTWWKLIQGRDC